MKQNVFIGPEWIRTKLPTHHHLGHAVKALVPGVETGHGGTDVHHEAHALGF